MVYEVHPVADLFPMLADDELAELAESIKQRGLDHPVVLDADGRILDGRNRLAACELAGVEPRFETYQGDDAEDYALRSGITRRHLTTGARAMIAAKAARLNGHDYKSVVDTESKITDSRLGEASTVLDWCDATTVNNVIAGTTALSTAVETARNLKKEDADREAKKTRLREGAPDLLTQVDDGEWDLDEAIGALQVREEKARQEREAEEAEQRKVDQEKQESAERDAQRLRHIAASWGALETVIDFYETRDAWHWSREVMEQFGGEHELMVRDLLEESIRQKIGEIIERICRDT